MKKLVVKKLLCVLAICSIAFCSVSINAATSKKPKITHTSKKTKVGSYFTLSISNANNKVKWKISNKSIVKITKKHGIFNRFAKFKGVKAGTVIITAKTGNKTFKCKVTIQNKKKTGKGKTVYIADTGTKYHTSTCRFVHDSKTAVKLSWAKQNGYTACSVCRP